MKRSFKFFIIASNEEEVTVEMELLRNAGHSMKVFMSATDALEAAEADPPDCILATLTMPDMDAMRLCHIIGSEERYHNLKLIILSNKPYEFDQKRCLQPGANGFIFQPVNEVDFMPDIERVCLDKVEVCFWGVRGTLPVPGPHALRYGGQTNCITLEFARGQLFIFDAGTGIKALSDVLEREERDRINCKIFISHPHWDHINALPFFSPLYQQGSEIEILGPSHGNTTMRELISAQMDGVYFPIKIKEFAARVYFRNLREEEIDIEGIKIRTMLLSHPGNCLGYRIEYNNRSLCYITDNELYPQHTPHYNEPYRKRLIEFIKNTDILITDCTYTAEEYESKISWGHSSVNEVVDIAHRANVNTLYLYHHDPAQDDDAIDAKLAIAQELLTKLESTTKVVAPSEGDFVML